MPNVNDRPRGGARNSGRGFSHAALELRLSRKPQLGEHRNLEVIAEGFNLLNRANLQLPKRGFGASKAAADPRQIQRLNF